MLSTLKSTAFKGLNPFYFRAGLLLVYALLGKAYVMS
mgnify:CR=1 FL=1